MTDPAQVFPPERCKSSPCWSTSKPCTPWRPPQPSWPRIDKSRCYFLRLAETCEVKPCPSPCRSLPTIWLIHDGGIQEARNLKRCCLVAIHGGARTARNVTFALATPSNQPCHAPQSLFLLCPEAHMLLAYPFLQIMTRQRPCHVPLWC